MPAMIKPVVISFGGTHVVYDGLAMPPFDAGWFESAEPQGPPAASAGHPAAGGRGRVSFLSIAGRLCVLKHYRRGGLLARFVSDRYLYAGLQRTRSFSEWHFLSSLQALRLPAPVPLAARCRRFGLLYTADLITEYCRNTRSLAQILHQRPMPISAWLRLGRLIRRYHDAGVHHADLNAHNILLDEERGEAVLIDFDRARRSHCTLRHRLSLTRLERSLNKLAGSGVCPEYRAEDFRVLLSAYEGSS